MTTVVQLDEHPILKKDVLGSSATSDRVQQPLSARQQQSTIDQSEPEPEPHATTVPHSGASSATVSSFILFLAALRFFNHL